MLADVNDDDQDDDDPYNDFAPKYQQGREIWLGFIRAKFRTFDLLNTK
jgi:hypothetical protein